MAAVCKTSAQVLYKNNGRACSSAPARLQRAAYPLLLLLIVIPPPTSGAEELHVRVYAGVFNTNAWVYDAGGNDTIEGGFELHLPPISPWRLAPLIGTSTNKDEAALYYTGLQWRHSFSSGWISGISFAVAHYKEGDSKRLGSDLEFRSGVELAYGLNGGQSLGAQFYHISNAGIDDFNPGNNSLVFFYSIPARF